MGMASRPARGRSRRRQPAAARLSFINMLLREGATGQREVVLIDWADCGVAPLGAELNALVGTSSLVFG